MKKPKPPKLEGVRWLWADDWWDWVVTGVVEYQGKRYYAFSIKENYKRIGKWFRRYLVVDLPEGVWKEENERHALFVEKVGSHFEFDGEYRREPLEEHLKPEATWHEFYDRYPPNQLPRNYKQYPVIGWFEN